MPNLNLKSLFQKKRVLGLLLVIFISIFPGTFLGQSLFYKTEIWFTLLIYLFFVFIPLSALIAWFLLKIRKMGLIKFILGLIALFLFLVILGLATFVSYYYLDRLACKVHGGEYMVAGLSGRLFCNLKYKDGGKPCSDSSECEGRCITESLPPFFTGLGYCEKYHATFGCYGEVENGELKNCVCVD